MRKLILAGFKVPGYDDGGTVASTGLAVVHRGEAVIPQADISSRTACSISATAAV